jgi:small subunit ribosomal protein S11
MIAEDAASRVITLHSMENVDVYIKWIGVWREQAVRWLISAGLNLDSIFDVTPVPHNGCKKKKTRRL